MADIIRKFHSSFREHVGHAIQVREKPAYALNEAREVVGEVVTVSLICQTCETRPTVLIEIHDGVIPLVGDMAPILKAPR